MPSRVERRSEREPGQGRLLRATLSPLRAHGYIDSRRKFSARRSTSGAIECHGDSGTKNGARRARPVNCQARWTPSDPYTGRSTRFPCASTRIWRLEVLRNHEGMARRRGTPARWSPRSTGRPATRDPFQGEGRECGGRRPSRWRTSTPRPPTRTTTAAEVPGRGAGKRNLQRGVRDDLRVLRQLAWEWS